MSLNSETTFSPWGVTRVPPPPGPPTVRSTTGASDRLLRASMISQAVLYEMPVALAAAVMEPSSATFSSRATRSTLRPAGREFDEAARNGLGIVITIYYITVGMLTVRNRSSNTQSTSLARTGAADRWERSLYRSAERRV